MANISNKKYICSEGGVANSGWLPETRAPLHSNDTQCYQLSPSPSFCEEKVVGHKQDGLRGEIRHLNRAD